MAGLDLQHQYQTQLPHLLIVDWLHAGTLSATQVLLLRLLLRCGFKTSIPILRALRSGWAEACLEIGFFLTVPDRVVWKIICAWVITVCIWTCSKACASWWWLASQLLALWSHAQSRNSCSRYVCIPGIFHWTFCKLRRTHAFFSIQQLMFAKNWKSSKSALFFFFFNALYSHRSELLLLRSLFWENDCLLSCVVFLDEL